jgi:sulfur-oxidizing protein SoxX
MVGVKFILAATTLAIGATTAAAGDIAPTQVKFTDLTVTAPLTDKPGDPKEGRKTFVNKKLGNCLACHANKDIPEQAFQGEVGPSLDGVAGRYKPVQLRAIVTNSKAVFGPDTVMPGFYSLDVGKHVRKDLVGKTILSAQQVEDIVAYLSTLK